MSNWDKEIGSILKYLESKGPNWLLSAPKREGVVLGIDEEGMKRAYCFPTVTISHTADLSNDVDIVFVKDYKNSKFKLNCTFKVDSVVKEGSPIPMRLFSVWVALNLETVEKKTKLPLQVSISSDNKSLTASTLVNVKEFDFLAECFEKGYVYFTWGGEVRWYDVSDPALLAALQGKNTTEKVSLTTSTANVSGRVDDILIQRDNETTYGAVLGTLDWEDEHFDQYVVWFKDMMTQNAYYLLPQIYWIKANPKDNSPSINVTVPSWAWMMMKRMRQRCPSGTRLRYRPIITPDPCGTCTRSLPVGRMAASATAGSLPAASRTWNSDGIRISWRISAKWASKRMSKA